MKGGKTPPAREYPVAAPKTRDPQSVIYVPRAVSAPLPAPDKNETSLTTPSGNPQSAIPNPQSELASLALRTDDARAALRAMLDLFVATFHADAGAIALLSPDSGQLEIEVQTGLWTDDIRQPVKIGHGVTGWCVLNRRSLLVPDVAAEPRHIAVRPGARCEMAAPIQDDDQVIGVIDLESDRINGFTPADLELLETLAAEAARVLQTAVGGPAISKTRRARSNR